MCIGLHRSEVVDADHLDVLAIVLGDGAQHVAADAAKAVDGDPNCHGLAPGLGLLVIVPVVAFAPADQSAKRNPPGGLSAMGWRVTAPKTPGPTHPAWPHRDCNYLQCLYGAVADRLSCSNAALATASGVIPKCLYSSL